MPSYAQPTHQDNNSPLQLHVTLRFPQLVGQAPFNCPHEPAPEHVTPANNCSFLLYQVLGTANRLIIHLHIPMKGATMTRFSYAGEKQNWTC